MSDNSEIDNLVLILTAQCNLHCTYCYQTAKKALTMERATLRASLDLALGCASTEVRVLFVGGEPLLEWPLISEAGCYAAQQVRPGTHLEFEISSNGLLMTEEIATFLDEHKFKVQLSFDGIEPAQRYRGEGSFAQLDDLLDRLREKRPHLFRSKLRVSTVQIPSTIPYLAESIRYLIQKGVQEIGMSPSLIPSPGWRNHSLQELDFQFNRIYEDSLDHFERTGEVPLEIFRRYENEGGHVGATALKCSAETGNTIVVDTDGQIYGCVMFAESYRKFASDLLGSCLAPLRMGDVRSAEFQDHRTAYLKAVRSASLFREKEKRYSSYGNCTECPYLDDCFVCPVSIAYNPANTDPHRIADFICAFNQVALKYRQQFPCIPDPLEKLNLTLQKLATKMSTGAPAR